jgi:hypothetical protein
MAVKTNMRLLILYNIQHFFLIHIYIFAGTLMDKDHKAETAVDM